MIRNIHCTTKICKFYKSHEIQDSFRHNILRVVSAAVCYNAAVACHNSPILSIVQHVVFKIYGRTDFNLTN
jgi:hypothetical protein